MKRNILSIVALCVMMLAPVSLSAQTKWRAINGDRHLGIAAGGLYDTNSGAGLTGGLYYRLDDWRFSANGQYLPGTWAAAGEQPIKGLNGLDQSGFFAEVDYTVLPERYAVRPYVGLQGGYLNAPAGIVSAVGVSGDISGYIAQGLFSTNLTPAYGVTLGFELKLSKKTRVDVAYKCWYQAQRWAVTNVDSDIQLNSNGTNVKFESIDGLQYIQSMQKNNQVFHQLSVTLLFGIY